jgi:hypothetical protein
MERVKDLSKIKMPMGYVLIEIVMKKSKIIAPTKRNEKLPDPLASYAIVTALSQEINNVSVGDIVLDFRSDGGFIHSGRHYAMVPRMNIRISVSPDNFQPEAEPVDDITKLN